MPVVVIKLGGSILRRPDVVQNLKTVCHAFPQHQPLLVVGGGPAADLVRQWQPLHQLSEPDAHWVAIASLRLTATLILRLIPESVLVSTLAAAKKAWSCNQWPIIDIETCLMSAEQGSAETLPHTWDVTSDSIAAWLAAEWQLDNLCLVKSVPLPTMCWLADAARIELVDPYFAGLAGKLKHVYWAAAATNPTTQEASLTVLPWLEFGVPVN